MRVSGFGVGGVGLVIVLLAGTAVGAPEPQAPPGATRYEYAVRCVFKGAESSIVANYKLKCNGVGSEITYCPPLEYEPCRLKLINEMGQAGWRFVGVDELEGLGPNNSVTFERPSTAVPVLPVR